MAANTSFKVQCPSCEAMVPIRDPNLVGRKIDCTKCKYRFVVEEPDGDEADDREARRPAAKAKPKPKKGGNNVLILGSIIGGVALIVLGVVAYMIFAPGGDTGPVKPSTPPVAVTTTPTPATTTPTPTPPATTTDAGAAAATTTPAAAATNSAAGNTLSPGIQTPVAEISNLLPNDTHSVISINMDRLRNSTLGQQAFESRVGFHPSTFKNGFGIGVEEIARFVRAEHLGGQNWTFSVVSTHRPVTLAEFQGPLALTKGPKSPIQGREYFVVGPNALLDNLSSILQSELEAKDSRAPEKKKVESSGPLTLALINPTTVVVANQDVMEEFLQANAEPQKKSKLAGDGAGGSNPAPSGGGLPPPTTPGRGPGRGTPAAGDDAEPGGTQFADRNAYLTVDPHLKAMLDRMEGSGENVVLSMAQLLQADQKLVNRLREATGVPVEVQGMRTLGVGLHQINVEKFKGEIALEMFREQSAKDFEEQIKKVLGPAGRLLGLYLGGLHIDVEGADGGGSSGGPSGGPGGGLTVTTPGGGGGPGRGRGPGGPGGGPDDQNPAGGEGPKSKLKFERKGRSLLLDVDLSLNERAYDRIYALSEGVVMRMKGLVDMASGEPRFYELAEAAAKYRADDLTVAPKDKEKKPKETFPRATFPRDESLGRLSRTWPPNQRVSWMAGLLPYLGYQEIYDGIQLRNTWRTDVNMKAGAALIPQFLNPRFPRPTWRAHPPSIGVTRDLGATHYVGIAGVGIDAADYSASDPAAAKKLGVFGYERRTSVKDVTDGLANTAYMVQVPPTHQRPWIAGGGATVTGIPDTRSVQPFVSTQANGKRGTYLVMGDGSVRFIKDDISDDVFKALCTIKGGETVDVNAEAPKVDRPKGPSMKTADAGKTAAAPAGQ